MRWRSYSRQAREREKSVSARIVLVRSEAQLFSARRSNYKRNELYRENSRAAIIRAPKSPNYYVAIRVNGQDQRRRARVLSLIGAHFHFGIVLINRDYNWQLGMPGGRERIGRGHFGARVRRERHIARSYGDRLTMRRYGAYARSLSVSIYVGRKKIARDLRIYVFGKAGCVSGTSLRF